MSNCLSTIDNHDLTVTNQSLSGFTIRIISFGIIPDRIFCCRKNLYLPLVDTSALHLTLDF